MTLILWLRRLKLKKNLRSIAVVAFIFSLVFAANAMAAESDVNIPITANQAFDAVVKQVDPATGEKKSVALIDVRTTSEYYYVGGCSNVKSITTERFSEIFHCVHFIVRFNCVCRHKMLMTLRNCR
jgi:hypothetical protein